MWGGRSPRASFPPSSRPGRRGGGTEEALPGLSYLTGPLSAGSQRQAAAGPISAAVAGAMGWVAINQSSGVGHGQANGVAMALSINGTAVADSTLAATLPEAELTSDAGNAPPGPRTATLEACTCRGAKGVVQVNQAAGSWNRTANNFALSISVDVNP